jgi:opacity protein-like surface antigen
VAAQRALLFLSLSVAFAPLSALAADLPTRKAPPPVFVQPSDWSGFYAGSFVGGNAGVFDTSRVISQSGTGYGLTTGVLIGYNIESNKIVYGLEGDLQSNYAIHKFAPQPGMIVGSEVSNIYTLHGRARLGYDLGEFMPYIAGGIAYGRNEQYLRAPFEFDGDTVSQVGWTIGAGLDWRVNLPVLGPSTLRGEYVYDSFPTATYNLNGPIFHTATSEHTVRVALISRVGDSWHSPGPDVVDWSGDYVGALVGETWASATTKGFGTSTKVSASGVTAGVYTGHNWMFGQGLLGIEGATMLANVTGHGPQPGAVDSDYREFSQSDIRGRAGYAFGRFLPFVAAGISYSQSQQIDTISHNNVGNVSPFSWTIGGGVDYMLTERLAARAEYVYTSDFSNETTHLDADTCCSQRRSSDTVRFGLAYYFH